MTIVLNGTDTSVPDEISVLGLLQHLNVDPGRVAVEVDGRIVRRSDWPSEPVAGGAKVEVVHFVGGGRN